MTFGSVFFGCGGGGGVRRIAPRTAASRSAEADGTERGEPHVEQRQLAGADGAGDERRHARRVLGRRARRASPSPLGRCAGASALTGFGERGLQALAREHELEAQRLEVRAWARRAAPNASSAATRPAERVGELGVLGVQRLRARRPPPGPTAPSGAPERHGGSQRLGLLAAQREGARGHHRQRGRELGSIAGRSMTSAHQAAKGPSHRTSSTSPSAVPRVVSTRRQKSALSAPLSDGGSSREPSARPSSLRSQRQVSCAVGPRPGPRRRVLAARVERVAAEPQREHLERQVRVGLGDVDVPSPGLAGRRSRDEIEDLRGRARERASRSPRGRARRRARPPGASRPAAATRGGARRRARSPRARSWPRRAGAACRRPGAMRRASSKVGAREAAKRAARASASSSSYCAAMRTRFSRPSSRSSGSRSAPSTASVTAMTSIQRRASSSEVRVRAERAISRRARSGRSMSAVS